jgi:hypothetical protein
MKKVINYVCPHCGHKNSFVGVLCEGLQFEITTCDEEEGGCGKILAVQYAAIVRIDVKTNPLTDFN